MEPSRPDHLTLLISDAERALHGLQHSLTAQGAQGMPQAALHALDLSNALTSVGLQSQADLLQSVSQELSLGQPAAVEVATELLPLITQTLTQLQSGQPLPPQETVLTQWNQRLSAQSQQDTPPAGTTSSLAGASTKLPGLGSGASLSLEPTSGGLLRQHGLDLLQHARVLNLQAGERDIRMIDALLSELQDRACRFDQIPLRHLYSLAHHQTDDAWVDQDILRLLQQLQPWALQARRIQVNCRSLVLFIDWIDLTLHEEGELKLGQVVRTAGGRVDTIPNGYRLCLPTSLNRMRMQAFEMGGRRFAVSSAQCLTPAPLGYPVDRQPTLELVQGFHHLTLQVDRLLHHEHMNIFLIPPGVPRPEGVESIALDGKGQVYLRFESQA